MAPALVGAFSIIKDEINWNKVKSGGKLYREVDHLLDLQHFSLHLTEWIGKTFRKNYNFFQHPPLSIRSLKCCVPVHNL